MKAFLNKSWILIVGCVLVFIYMHNFVEEYFIIDDDVLIGAPQVASQVSALTKVRQIFTPGLHYDYYPVRDLTYLLDWAWGIDLSVNLLPAKLQNLLWFLLIGWLSFRLMLHLHIPKDWAQIIASIWLLHPANAELLLWASARKDLVALALTLLGAVWLIDIETDPRSDRSRCSWLRSLGAIVAFTASGLAKAGLLLVPAGVGVALLLVKCWPSKKIVRQALGISIVLGFGLILLQKWQYSAVNDMAFNYTLNYRLQGIVTAFGKMVAGLFYFPAIIIDCENWGEWVSSQRPYSVVGLLALGTLIGGAWHYRKNKQLLFWIIIISCIYVLIPGPNIYHRNFFSNRYFSPVFLVAIIGLAHLQRQAWPTFNKRTVKTLIIVAIIFCGLVVRESRHWLSNKDIWDKSVRETQAQPNALQNRLITYLNLKRWGQLNEDDLATLEEDAEKLHKLCVSALTAERANGSLCFGYWRNIKELKQTHPPLFASVTEEEIVAMHAAFNKDLGRLTKEVVIPYVPGDSFTASRDFQAYSYYRKLHLDNTTEKMRILHLVDVCFRGNSTHARALAEEKQRNGLIRKHVLFETVGSVRNPDELKKLQDCFIH